MALPFSVISFLSFLLALLALNTAYLHTYNHALYIYMQDRHTKADFK